MITKEVRLNILKGGLVKEPYPEGLKQLIANQIDYIRQQSKIDQPKNILIIGGSSGYGLATRIALTYATDANIISINLQKGPTKSKVGSPEYWNDHWYEYFLKKNNIDTEINPHRRWSTSINADAFSAMTKKDVSRLLDVNNIKLDLVIYSVAAPKRTVGGITYNSSLKSCAGEISAPALDLKNKQIVIGKMEQATDEDINNTIKVMGGEDWEEWINILKSQDLLTIGFKTTAYTFIGGRATDDIYGNGTIGAAKRHLEYTAKKIDEFLKDIDGEAFSASLKTIVTKSSAHIPMSSLYACALYKVMKEKKYHESTIEHIYRFFNDMVYGDKRIIDEHGRVRADHQEMLPDVQCQVEEILSELSNDNIDQISDLKSYYDEFLQIYGFNVPNVDYSQPVSYEL